MMQLLEGMVPNSWHSRNYGTCALEIVLKYLTILMWGYGNKELTRLTLFFFLSLNWLPLHSMLGPFFFGFFFVIYFVVHITFEDY